MPVDASWFNDLKRYEKELMFVRRQITKNMCQHILPKEEYMKYPKIYLAIDNCFASKRWTEPEEWMALISSLGLSCAEGSADTECDPLYHGENYLSRWSQKVNAAKEKYNIRMANLYSGHGTYSTLGLAHTDSEVHSRFLNQWLKKMVDVAGTVEAGLGFYCHAFSDFVLQDTERYEQYKQRLIDDLSELAGYAGKTGSRPVGIEQMYTPHQIPWTVEGAKSVLSQVFGQSGAPFYLTIDTGHQIGQRKFLRPNEETLSKIVDVYDSGEFVRGLWVGSKSAIEIFENRKLTKTRRIQLVESEMDRFPYLFAGYDDCDPYHWLRELACYSPIIHLQQTDGKSSGHWPFTPENNDIGIIEPAKILKAIADCYGKIPDNTMPSRVEEIFLTLEIFTGTAAINRDQLEDIRCSVEHWRSFIPKDGLSLDNLL